MTTRSQRRSSVLRSAILGAVLVLLGVLAIVAASKQAKAPSNADETLTNSANTNANTNIAPDPGEKPSGSETKAGTTTTYTDPVHGFTLQYSSDWKVSQTSSGSGADAITNVTFGTTEHGVTLVIAPSTLSGMMMETFSAKETKDVMIHGMTASRSTGTQTKDGKAVGLLSFTKDGTVFLLNGQPDTVDTVGATFTFLNK